MTRKLVLLAAIALLLPCLATATTVTFTTSGKFGNPSLFPTLTFTGDTSPVSTPGGNVSFGTFNLTTGCSPTCSGSEGFTLHIVESSPTNGTGDINVTLHGRITGQGTNLVLTFKTAVVQIHGGIPVTYSLPFQESINFGGPTTLNGNVVAPEPNARFLLGLGTLGLVGLTLVTRKMIKT